MVIARYEEYTNDLYRKEKQKTFRNLEELTEWIFGQMKQDYSDKEHGWVRMSFPVFDKPTAIEFRPEHGGPAIWIHLLESDEGIILSDGRYTARQKHRSKEVLDWANECKKRQYAPKFAFAE